MILGPKNDLFSNLINCENADFISNVKYQQPEFALPCSVLSEKLSVVLSGFCGSGSWVWWPKDDSEQKRVMEFCPGSFIAAGRPFPIYAGLHFLPCCSAMNCLSFLSRTCCNTAQCRRFNYYIGTYFCITREDFFSNSLFSYLFVYAYF